MNSKITSAACIVSLLIGIILGVFAVDRGSPDPSPAPVVVPTPDPVPDTPTPGAPIKVAVGELVRLTEETGKSVAWTVEPPIDDIQTYGDRNESSVTSYRAKGVYTIIAAIITTHKWYELSDSIVLKRYTVIVGDAVPAPRPSPVPTPEPSPGPLPEPAPVPAINGFSDLAKLAPDPAQAAKLAASFRGVAKEVADSIADRKLIRPDDIVEITRASNNEALGSSVPAWSAFFTAMEAELTKRAKDGKLNTMQDHVDTWNEIATALEGVK